jgi:hypothetical protein
MQNKGVWVDDHTPKNVEGHKIMIFGCIDFSYTQMGHGVSCPQKCIEFGNQNYVDSKSY